MLRSILFTSALIQLSASATHAQETPRVPNVDEQIRKQVDRFDGRHEWIGRVAYPLLDKVLMGGGK